MDKMFIPKKIKIGFVQRDDTFTGKLSYIIYFDEKGKLRKEASWNSWKDESIEPIEFDNTPQSGYIFNKGVKRDGYWGSGRSVIRVYDPRDFEFEISVDNLMGILMHSDISKRDIVEQCVFAWAGAELVLLPVNSEEYRASVAYTQKQDQKISSKELVPGFTYQAKKLDTPLIYMGQREWFDWNVGYEEDGKISRKYRYNQNIDYVELHDSKGNKHVFYDGENFITKTPADLSSILSQEVVSNYAELVDLFFKNVHSQKVIGLSPSDEVIPYYTDMFFIMKDYLVRVHLHYETSYKNQKYETRPTFAYSSKKLEYPYSLKMVHPSQKHYVLKDFETMKAHFQLQFAQYHEHAQYALEAEKAKKWVKKQGGSNSYNMILENGNEIHSTR